MEDDRASITPPSGSSDDDDGDVIGEPRWPMAGPSSRQSHLRCSYLTASDPGPNWALPVLEAVLLVVLIVGDPGAINRGPITHICIPRRHVG